MGTPPYCHRCPNQEESTLHALRDCPCAALVWNNSTAWTDIFITTCWWLWKWRNKELHEPAFSRPTNDGCILIIMESSRRIEEAFKKSKLVEVKRDPVISTIAWVPPHLGWVKLNIDGSVITKQASCGGLIRTSKGEWVGGFSANLDYCQATQAELWGVHYGLHTTWSLGMRRVIVELDSLNAIMYIKRNPSDSHGHSHIIQKIAEWMKRLWEIIFRHVYREVNRCADWLARSTQSQLVGYSFIDLPPSDLQSLLIDDLTRVSISRTIFV
ncbi:hypothetical protein AHAS_Ahas11G0092200 [Arachis hypogaea]